MQRIAVLTSGGDAPGMNAAIRAVVRTGVAGGLEVFGVNHGYQGLIADEMSSLTRRDVGGIMQLGGTVLGSARCPEFETVPGRQTALANLARRGIEALVVIGGNGSQAGAHALWQMGFPTVGIASTIDNDLEGTDLTIGVDSAINVALEAIDRLKVTAASHRRAFLVEVMGRNCGYVALMAGIAGGAEVVVIPEREIPPRRSPASCATPTTAARPTPWWWWPRAPRTTPSASSPISPLTRRRPAFCCAPRSWGTSSAAPRPPRPTGCSARASARAPSAPSSAARAASWPACAPTAW